MEGRECLFLHSCLDDGGEGKESSVVGCCPADPADPADLADLGDLGDLDHLDHLETGLTGDRSG